MHTIHTLSLSPGKSTENPTFFTGGGGGGLVSKSIAPLLYAYRLITDSNRQIEVFCAKMIYPMVLVISKVTKEGSQWYHF